MSAALLRPPITRTSELLTREEAAVYMGVSHSRLAHGWGPKPIQGYKRPVMYSRQECDQFIRDCCDIKSKQVG